MDEKDLEVHRLTCGRTAEGGGSGGGPGGGGGGGGGPGGGIPKIQIPAQEKCTLYHHNYFLPAWLLVMFRLHFVTMDCHCVEGGWI